MTVASFEEMRIEVEGVGSVSALLGVPPEPSACYVFAHGAGAGMAHAFMASELLGERRIATLRFQFPFMERGSKRPDTPRIAHAAVRSAVAEARKRWPGLPLFAGGKSFGGRMSSQAQADRPMPGVQGLVFVGFPLHPVGKPSIERGAHLAQAACPMLFLQGTRDELADISLLKEALQPLGERATLRVFDDADHAFHVRVRSGQTDAEVRSSLADAIAGWISTVV